jgi:hypothetical protein
MKFIKYTASAALSALVLNCSGSTSDPSTISAQDLAPPGYVQSVTQSGKIELRWIASNAEDDFKGFYVFGSTKTRDELQEMVAYPNADVEIDQIGIPRCEDNTAFFEAFGLKETDSGCDGALSAASTDELLPSDGMSRLMDEESEDEETLQHYLACEEEEDAQPSLPVTASGLTTGLKRCTVSHAYDPDAGELVDLEDGTTYSFIVVAVRGEDLNKISWTSNVVKDTPSVTAYATADITLSTDKYRVLTLNSGFTSVDVSSSESNCAGNTSDLCAVAGTNTVASGDNKIFIARDGGSGTFEQRIFVSTSNTGNMQLIPRGPQTRDETSETPVTRVPGDQAVENSASNSPYLPAGTVLTAYTNKVFDISRETSSGVFHYGKIIFGEISYASASNESAATIEVTIVTQPKNNEIDYFQ